MKTLDLRKELKPFYAPSTKKPELIEVPEFQFAMLDGAVEPGVQPGDSPAFQQAVEALYGISYTLKFMLKQRKDDPIDYPVMALEGLWWVENGVFKITDPSNWHWTLMILQPGVITPALFEEGLAALRKKRGDQPAFARLRLEPFSEGWCVQMMHVGPYAAEPETLARMQAFANENGWTISGRHHEIYLGDPRRADPANLKTILRHQVQK